MSATAPKKFPKLQQLLSRATPRPAPSVSRKHVLEIDLESIKEQKIVKVDRFEFINIVKEKIAEHDFGIPLNSTEYYCRDTGEQILVVSTTSVKYNERAKYLCEVKAVITSNRTYYIQALFKIVEEGNVETVDDVIGVIQKLVASDMRICPGIDVKTYESLKDSIRHDQKESVQITNDPFTRISSVKCTPFFHQKRKNPECYECLKLLRELKDGSKRKSSVTAAAKLELEKADSHHPLKSPASLEKRKANNKHVLSKKSRALKKPAPDEVIVDDKQTEEVVCETQSSQSDNVSSSELLSIFAEGEEQREGLDVTLRQLLENAERNKNKDPAGSFQTNQELSLVINS